MCDGSGYDADLNSHVETLEDGVLILRYLFTISGPVLTQGALGQGAQRTDPAAIVAHLDCIRATLLDVDDNDQAQALEDGVLLLRYLFGIRGEVLTLGAVGEGCHRCDADPIGEFIDDNLP